MQEDHEEPGPGRNEEGTAPEPLDLNDLALPWERPGAARRDCAPHRAQVLVGLASAALVCGVLAFLLGVPGVIGLPLGAVAYVLAGRDLDRMQQGLLDPRGRQDTDVARQRGVVGMLVSTLGLGFWPWLCCGLFLLTGLERLP
jgi:hypothetical protein